MLRLIVAIVLTALFVAFGMANGHHVPVNMVLGGPVHVRQIFLLLSAVSIGVVSTLLVQQYNRVVRQRERESFLPPGKTMDELDEFDDLADD